MDHSIYQYYLRLFHSEKIPLPVFSRLLREFGSTRALLALPSSTLQNLGFDEDQINILQNSAGTNNTQRQVDAALEWASNPDTHLLCYESEYYPAALREIDSAPPLLFVRGLLSLLKGRLFSIVGSRRASIYGKRNAYWIARELGKAGLKIVSGLASGIDTKAHEGTLDGGGETIAVIGTGIDRVYPARNAALVNRIVENGALLSEFPLGTPPYPSNFPRRNRIISGLAEGTLVVEGGIKSGSLITARLAMEQNRDVFALPGPIGSVGSSGCHHLIKQGAKLVEEPVDILEEQGFNAAVVIDKEPRCAAQADTEKGKKREAAVLDAIERHGSLFEAILGQCNLEMQELSSELIRLEANGVIQKQGGRYFRYP